MTLADDLRHNAIDHINGDRKADACAGAGWRDDGGVDADQPSGGVKERSTGITGIDRGVGLNDVRDFPAPTGRQMTLERADDSSGQGLVEPKWIADREHRLADFKVIGRADRKRWRQVPAESTRITARS